MRSATICSRRPSTRLMSVIWGRRGCGALQTALDELVAIQEKAIEYAGKQHSDAEILYFINGQVYPHYDAVSDCLETVIAFSDAKVQSLTKISFSTTVISIVYPQAQSKDLQFMEKATGFSEHTTFVGISLRLNQILLNITSNALKFTSRGGSISLKINKLPSRGQKVWMRFIMSDTGIGMDEDALSRLYKPFEQANASILHKYGGTGLGMSITENLVSLMSGYILFWGAYFLSPL